MSLVTFSQSSAKVVISRQYHTIHAIKRRFCALFVWTASFIRGFRGNRFVVFRDSRRSFAGRVLCAGGRSGVAVCRPACGRRMCPSRCCVAVWGCARIGARGQLPALFCSFSASSWARDLDLVTSQTPAKTQRAAAPLVNPNVSSPMATVNSTATTGWT